MGDYTDSPDQSASSSASVDSTNSASNPPIDPTTPDPNRPNSTILADSSPSTPSAQPEPAVTEVQPVPTPELQPNQVLEGSASAEIISPADSTAIASPSADLQPPVPVSPLSPESPQLSDVPEATASAEPQSSPPPTPTEAPKETSIQDTSPLNPPPQVQPSVLASAPSITSPPIDQPPKESAGIKLEPLDGTQNTIPADSKPPEAPKSTSFGDLMGNPSDLSEEPAIHIDPIEAPTTPPITPELPPVVQRPPVENHQAELAMGRQRSVDVRKQQREEHLNSIVELAQKKSKIDNLDVRDFLHISQTTATDYLRTLVNSGKLKREGKAKATKYSL